MRTSQRRHMSSGTALRIWDNYAAVTFNIFTQYSIQSTGQSMCGGNITFIVISIVLAYFYSSQRNVSIRDSYSKPLFPHPVSFLNR